eukprot:TRINITY_DN9514_c0_g1_i1.p1 TRINITY_DN9514_c0_g1~~TRINITY_DN9514_c0_g1_i1.p1  ORF type:complete len:118 (-),score=24.79 TRINITY_DN9514_c0_g1_i1:24-344(-)
MEEINLLVKVVKRIASIESIDNQHRYSEIVVGDETGCITLSASDDEIDTLSPGSNVQIDNARIVMKDGRMFLYIGRWGSVSASDQKIRAEVNVANNCSAVVYEWVV